MPSKAPPILVVDHQDAAAWPVKRRIELNLLGDLLNEAAALNRGSDFIGRATRIIQLAEQLTRTEVDKPRPSFYQFLVDEATSTKSDNGN